MHRKLHGKKRPFGEYAVGLVEPREAEVKAYPVTLGDFLAGYIDMRSDVKASTSTVYGHTQRCLVDFFGADNRRVVARRHCLQTTDDDFDRATGKTMRSVADTSGQQLPEDIAPREIVGKCVTSSVFAMQTVGVTELETTQLSRGISRFGPRALQKRCSPSMSRS